MKEVFMGPSGHAEIRDSPIPSPQPEQVVIKVVVTGSNPKDWKRAQSQEEPANHGDDIAGTVHAVGADVDEFKVGDRVAAFHEMMAPHGSFAEYAISEAHTTFHIPKQISFEEAATIPLAAMTAAFGLYQRLSLPLPWHPTVQPIPLIIYGAATAVGSFAIQLAQQSNVHPLICIAGKGTSHVESLINKDKGDIVLDYRKGNDELVKQLKAVRQSRCHDKIAYAFDCISEHNSYENISKVLDLHSGQITLILPGRDYSAIPESIVKTTTYVGVAHKDPDTDSWQAKTGGATLVGDQDFAYLFFRYFGKGLAKGYFRGHPYEVRPGGLRGVEQGLKDLKEGKVSAKKLVFRIADT